MKIRTITIGLPEIPVAETIRWAGDRLERASDFFISNGFAVQSRRIALGHWSTGLSTIAESERTAILEMIDSVCSESNIDFCSVGMISDGDHIEYISGILSELPRLNASAQISCFQGGPDVVGIRAAAKAVIHLAFNSATGFGNFRFGAGACLNAGIPYFPGSYHQALEANFTIGCENSGLLVEAFRGGGDTCLAKERLFDLLSMRYQTLEAYAKDLSRLLKLTFGGLDTSIAPSLDLDESIVQAFKQVNVEFGDVGTLSVCGAITDVLKQVAVKRTGYCGIMLPIAEDKGLAKAADSGKISVAKLLAYSSVCGVGIDMVPLPGDVSLQQLERLMFDVATVAYKLKKPLSVRVLPIPGKVAGDRTEFDSIYVCNSRILRLS